MPTNSTTKICLNCIHYMQNGSRGICLNDVKIVPLKDKSFIPKRGLGALFSSEILVGPYFGCIHFLDQINFKSNDNKSVYKKINLKAINKDFDEGCNYIITSFEKQEIPKSDFKVSKGNRVEITKSFHSSNEAFLEYHNVVKCLVDIVPFWYGVQFETNKRYKLIVQYALTDRNISIISEKLCGCGYKVIQYYS